MRTKIISTVKMFMLAGLLVCQMACSFGQKDEVEPYFYVGKGQRVVFLGDSITQDGRYVNYVEQYTRAHYPKREFEFLKLGLSSETVSGLSEKDHPFPRPDLHERLERVLKRTKPDVVVACYGINCGVYAPFDAERFAAYQSGIRRLVDAVQDCGAEIILMTPPPFLPKPDRLAMLQKYKGTEYGFRTPYADYDSVMREYGRWVQDLGKELGILTIDLHAAIMEHREVSYDSDPIHPNAFGHLVMAKALLQKWGAEEVVDEVVIDAGSAKVIRGKVVGLGVVNGSVGFYWNTKLPMAQNGELHPATAVDEQLLKRFNQHRLSVVGAKGARYVLYEGGVRIGELTAEQLQEGVDLASDIEGLNLKELSSNRKAADLAQLIALRRSTYDYALLNDIGHKRPNSEAMPIKEAKEKAKQLDERIRVLSQPVVMALRLELVEEEEGK